KVDLKHGEIDIDKVLTKISPQTKVIAIQRSKGYDQRPSIDLTKIESAIQQIKAQYPEIIIFVDNCYGEFVEEREPI
ncbi:methionine gamma-lyase family protein, partial [Staphylococcus pasteuri]